MAMGTLKSYILVITNLVIEKFKMFSMFALTFNISHKTIKDIYMHMAVQQLSRKLSPVQDAPKSYTPYIKYTKLQFKV